MEVAIQRDGIHTFEALVLARYQMNTQVYYHRLRRIYDIYLKEYFRAKGREEFDSPEKILKQNDMTMMAAIMRDADHSGEPYQPWAKRIRDRIHHRLVFESDEDAGAALIKRIRGVYERIQSEHVDIEFQWDLADVSIHKLLLPEDRDERGYVQFCVIDSDGRADLIGERSPILRKIPRGFQVTRIFADLGPDQDVLLRGIADNCRTYLRE